MITCTEMYVCVIYIYIHVYLYIVYEIFKKYSYYYTNYKLDIFISLCTNAQQLSLFFYTKYPKSLLENMDILHVNKNLHNTASLRVRANMLCIALLSL